VTDVRRVALGRTGRPASRLHVRTVRNYVATPTEAVRIGKQYRISRADLEELTGVGAGGPRESAGRARHVEVSSVVQVDAINATDAGRLDDPARRRRDGAANPTNRYCEFRRSTTMERASMKVIIIGGLADSARCCG
jgi:hypothetical protein